MINPSWPGYRRIYPAIDFVFMQDISSSYRAKATQDFFSKTCSWFRQCWRMGITLTGLEPFRLFSLGHIARTYVRRVTSTVCKRAWTWESNKTKMELEWRPNYKEGYLQWRSHRTGWETRTLVKTADNWLNTMSIFYILTCSTTLLCFIVPKFRTFFYVPPSISNSYEIMKCNTRECSMYPVGQ